MTLFPTPLRINDITNTTWYVTNISANAIGTMPTKNINFESNGKKFSSLEITIKQGTSIMDLSTVIMYDNEEVARGSGDISNTLVWTNDNYKTITFTGGNDVKNNELIEWLYYNAVLGGI